jgi:hypothetical protein
LTPGRWRGPLLRSPSYIKKERACKGGPRRNLEGILEGILETMQQVFDDKSIIVVQSLGKHRWIRVRKNTKVKERAFQQVSKRVCIDPSQVF